MTELTDTDVRVALTDRQVLAVTLYGEARGEPIEGKVAVGCVIRNRVKDPVSRFGTGYRSVCLAPYQFSCWIPAGGAANCAATHQAARILLAAGVGRVPNADLREALWIADGLTSGDCRDTVKGATHYLTRDLFEHNPPRWVALMRVMAAVGAHVFLKDEAVG